MNQQKEMTIILISPILVGFLILIEPIIIILYSKDFLPIYDMILWGALEFFKASSWALGVIFVSWIKTSFFSELSANSIMLILNLMGFYYFGLEGLEFLF